MKRKTRSAKAGLRFPVARIHRLLKSSTHSMRISALAPVYLSSVLEYLTAEILELSGLQARQQQQNKITPRHIKIAIKEDEDLEKLLSRVDVMGGGFIPKVNPFLPAPKVPKKGENKKRHKEKRKKRDMGRMHIGCPSTHESNHKSRHGKEHKRNRSLESNSFQNSSRNSDMSMRSNESSFSCYSQGSFVGNGSMDCGIGLAFRKDRTQTTNETVSTENNLSLQDDSVCDGSLSFQNCNEQSYLSNSFLSSHGQTMETSRDGNRSITGNYDQVSFPHPYGETMEISTDKNSSIILNCGSFPHGQSLEANGDGTGLLIGNYGAIGYDDQFHECRGSLEGSFSFQHDGASFGRSSSHYNHLEYFPQQDAFSYPEQQQDQSSLQAQDFIQSILERSTIPPNLLEISTRGASPNYNQAEESGMSTKIYNLDYNLKKDQELSKKIPTKKITIEDWRKSNDSQKQTQNNNLVGNEDIFKIGTLVHEHMLKNAGTKKLPTSQEKIEIEPKIASQSSNFTEQLMTDLQFHPESDSSEDDDSDCMIIDPCHANVSELNLSKTDNRSIVQSKPIKSNEENTVKDLEWSCAGIEDEENSLLQDHKVSSSLGPLGSSYSCSSSNNSSPNKPGPRSKQKYNVGDLVWGRFVDSSFYPAVVTNDPHYKFHTKIVETSPGSDQDENDRHYHLQFLYKSSQRSWLPDGQIIPFEGITSYERRAKKDVENMNRYRPRNSYLRQQWREAVLAAKRLENLGKSERIRKCGEARLKYLNVKGKEGKSNGSKDEQNNVLENQCEGKGFKNMTLKENVELKDYAESRGPTKEIEQSKLNQQQNKNAEHSYTEYRRQKREFDQNKLNQEQNKNAEHSYSEYCRQRKENEENKLTHSLDIISKDKSSDRSQISIPPELKSVELKKQQSLNKKREEFGINKSSNINVKDKASRISSSTIDVLDKKEIDKSFNGNDTRNKGKLTEKILELVSTEKVDNFPRPGDLVWGRMKGFPHWPAFITESPIGLFKKEGKLNGKSSYHVQFFNWNNESGWVDSIVRFDGVDQFKNTYTFYKMKLDSLLKKWNQAGIEAEQTLGLSRRERLDEYLVPYGEL